MSIERISGNHQLPTIPLPGDEETPESGESTRMPNDDADSNTDPAEVNALFNSGIDVNSGIDENYFGAGDGDWTVVPAATNLSENPGTSQLKGGLYVNNDLGDLIFSDLAAMEEMDARVE